MARDNMTVFQKALLQSVLDEYSDIPQKSELTDTYTESFKEWADGFIKEQTPQRIRMRRILRITLVAAILIVLLAGTVMAIPAVREAIIDYFFTRYEERYGVTFDPEAAATAPNEIKEVYVLGYIPDGFELIAEDKFAASASFRWMDNDGHMIIFIQDIIPDDPTDDSWIGIDAENSTKEEAIIGDYRVDIIRFDECYLLVWTNNSYFFTLQLPNAIDQETMTEILLSWKPAEQQ